MAPTIWADKGLVTLKEKYGELPTDFLVFTPPVTTGMGSSFSGQPPVFHAWYRFRLGGRKLVVFPHGRPPSQQPGRPLSSR